MKSGVTVTKDLTAVLMKALADIAKRDVLVGIPADAEGRDESAITNAELGMIHEFGAPGANIPARPFLIPGVQEAKGKVMPQLKKGLKAALDGDMSTLDKSLHAAGLIAQNEVKNMINEGDFVPLAPSTIAKRKAKGDDNPQPLVDTGQMKNAVTYVVREKK